MRSRGIVIAAITVLTLIAIAVLARLSTPEITTPKEPSRRDLLRLQDRIEHDRLALKRDGVLIASTGQTGQPCVSVELANPTAPNRKWLQDRYGPAVCVSRHASGGVGAITQMGCSDGPGRLRKVPDLVGLRADIARRRLLAAGFTEDCNHTTRGRAPDPYAVGNALYVTKVCNHSAPRGGIVRLQTSGHLPGGYVVTDQHCN